MLRRTLLLLGLLGAPGVPGRSQERVDLVVAATTDVHGRLRGWDYYAGIPDSTRGLTRVATIVDSLRAVHPGQVLLVDAGDFLQGNPLTDVAARAKAADTHPVIAAMNAIGYDGAIPGNHEFNYGLGALARARKQARFPFLAANAFLPNGQRAYPAYRILTRAGVRVALVGATQPGSMVWDRDHLRGKLVVRDIVAAVASATAAARREGADVVVVVMHSGFEEPASYDTAGTGVPSENVAARVAREVSGIDLIVFGHSHREMAGTVIKSTMLVQPRNWATSVTATRLTVERGRGERRWRVVAKHGSLIQARDHAEHPRVIAATERVHVATLAYVGKVIGATPVTWRAESARVSDTPIIDFILEVQRRRAGTDLASTTAFDVKATMDAGPITVAMISRLYPYENTLRAVRVTGRQLREYLEYSARYYRTIGSTDALAPLTDSERLGFNLDFVAGAEYALDVTRPVGSRLTKLVVRGRPVIDADTFTLALNSYRQTGGGGFPMLKDAPLIYDRKENIRDLLMEEVSRRGTLRPEDYHTRNWWLEPAEAVASLYPATSGRGLVEPSPQQGTSAHLAQGRWLRILATNDFHGALEPRRDASGTLRGGALALAREMAKARAECSAPACNTIVLDGGDEFQGTPASNFAFGRPVVALFNRLGYTAAALGNHEFDWGLDTLRARMRDAHYPILGANVLDSTGADVPWIPNDTLVWAGGVPVGIIGLATVATPSTTRASNVAALRFVAPAPVVDAHARALRARGARVIVVVAHAGAFCDRPPDRTCAGEIVDLAQRVTERVDAIVSGHTHSPVTTVVRNTGIVQARSNGTALGILDLPLDSGVAPVVALRDVLPQTTDADPGIDSIIRAAVAPVNERMRQPITRIAERIASGIRGPMGNLIADAQRAAGQGDVAVMNAGGVRAALDSGAATYGSVFEVQPFGNVLMRVTVRGRDLRTYLERLVGRREPNAHLSGAVVTFDTARTAGSRIASIVMSDGRPLDDERAYRLILSDFLATGGDGLGVSERAISVEELGIVDIDALIAYLRAQPTPVRAPRDQRLVIRSP